jgi:TonB family protein
MQCNFRKTGRVDNCRILKGRGYGLDEETIKTIAEKWRFKPGTLDGQPIDTEAILEVTMKLY